MSITIEPPPVRPALHRVFVATLRGRPVVTTWTRGPHLCARSGPLAEVLPQLGAPPTNPFLVWEGQLGRDARGEGPVGTWREPTSAELVAWFAGTLAEHWGAR